MASTQAGPLRGRLLRTRVYYGWYIVIGCFFLSMITAGTIFSFSVFLGPVLEAFGQTHASTSLIFSLQSLVTFGGAAVLGFAVDRYGVRRLLLISALLVVSGLLGASQSPSFIFVVVFYGFVAAAGLGITFVVAYTTPPRWFDRRRGLATGIAVSGWGVGILAFPPYAEVLIGELGWQGAYIGLGFTILLAITIAVILLADRPGELNIDVQDEFITPEARANAKDQTVETRSIRVQILDTIQIAKTRLFGLVFIGLLFAFVPSLAILVYLVEFAESVGLSRGVGVLGVSLIGALNVVAKFIAGAVADRIGMDITMVICVGLMFIATVLLVLVPTPVSIIILAAIFGLGYGGIAALMSPLVANLFGTADLSALFGVTSIGFAITGVTVPYFVGTMFDLIGTYEIPFLIVALFGLISAIAFATIRFVRPDQGHGMPI